MYWVVGHRKESGEEWWRSGPIKRKSVARQALRYLQSKQDVFCDYSITTKSKAFAQCK